MTMPVLASKVAEWAAIATTAIGGGMYIGSVSERVDQHDGSISELQPVATEVATDIATLEERTKNMQKDLSDIKAQQNNILLILQRK